MKPYLFVGVMSGTSADGIDVALVDFSQATPALVGSESHAYPNHIREHVLGLCTPANNEIDALGQLDAELGKLYAHAVNSLLANTQTPAAQIQAIGCHGQTVRHRPLGSGYASPFSLQIGDPNTIAALTGIATVADFRRKDVALGGQGAPLVPAFHAAVFGSTTTDRCIANIGGIANITCLPANSHIAGYDTGPGNALMDAWIEANQGAKYDAGGTWAQTGKLNQPLLEILLQHPYFALPAPKSTGREDFNMTWLQACLNQTNLPLPPEDVQATLTELTAISLTNGVKQSCPNAELVICGGGAFNTALLERIQHHYPQKPTVTSQQLGIAPTWVEAMAFAWLAMRRLENLPGNVPAVTGASREAVLGGIYTP